MEIQSTSTAAGIGAPRPALHLVPPPDPEHPPATRRSYALELADAPEALERVLGQLRRRRCRVTDVAYAAPYEPGAAANVVIGLETPAAGAELAAAWLAAPACVLSVERVG